MRANFLYSNDVEKVSGKILTSSSTDVPYGKNHTLLIFWTS